MVAITGRRIPIILLLVSVVGLVSLSTFAVSAWAFVEPGITGSYADLANCPANSATMSGETSKCAHSYTTGGVVQIGPSTVPISVPGDTLDLGIQDEETSCGLFGAGQCTISGPHGILNGPAQPVPGGLLGAIGNVQLTGVSAKLEWAKPVPPNAAFGSSGNCVENLFITFDLCKILNSRVGTAATLTVKVHLLSPFLGPNCYIGSSVNPIVIALTTGTTNPPPPNIPIHGKSFEYFIGRGQQGVIQLLGLKLVNNSFSVPGASGCGTSAGNLVNASINRKLGLPSPPGRNTIVIDASGEEQSSQLVLEHGWTGE